MNARRYLGDGYWAEFTGQCFYIWHGARTVTIREINYHPTVLTQFRIFQDYVYFLRTIPPYGNG